MSLDRNGVEDRDNRIVDPSAGTALIRWHAIRGLNGCSDALRHDRSYGIGSGKGSGISLIFRRISAVGTSAKTA